MIRDQYEETIVEKPPEGWTLGHVTLDLHYPDERPSVEAWRRGPFAVHFRHGVHGGEAIITHVPTGMRINPNYSFETLDSAAECAEKLEPLTDWSSIQKRLGSGSKLYPKVKAIIETVQRFDRGSAEA